MWAMVCFPEPDAHSLEDPVKAMGEYLAWATTDEARELRASLNDMLAGLPPDVADQFCHRLRTEPFRRVWFELFVGRFLQLLGADVVHEPVGANGRTPDWRATFPGYQIVYVEATSPDYNPSWDLARANHAPLLAILDKLMPEGWSYIVHHLPSHGPDDRRANYRHVVRQMLADVPPASTSSASFEAPMPVRGDTDFGPISLDLVPIRYSDGPFLIGPGYGRMDNSVAVIAAAVRGKRNQGRAFPGRVLLAVDAPSVTGLDDFERALFGSSVDYMDVDRRHIVPDIRFDATGALAIQGKAEFAGVLACRSITLLSRGPDPVVFPHPRAADVVPDRLMTLERRMFDGRHVNTIPATREPVIRPW